MGVQNLPADRPAHEYLYEAEAAELLRLSPRTLQRLRVEGGGPSYVQLTARRIAYPVDGLRAWATARTVGSTSQRAAA